MLPDRKEKPDFKPLYDINLPVTEKIGLICSKIYGARAVEYKDRALKEIKTIEDRDGQPAHLHAKTQFSLSDDPTLHGVPSDFVITVKEVRLSAGAGFIVALTGDIMTMPGLPRDPAARRMDIDSEGGITGLM